MGSCIVDLWGPIHRSHSANKYVLTMVDGYSKFAVISCLPNKKAHTIAGALYRNLFTKYAVPERIHSDLGKEFINKVLKEMYVPRHYFISHRSKALLHLTLQPITSKVMPTLKESTNSSSMLYLPMSMKTKLIGTSTWTPL